MERYKIEELLGEGSFGSVYLVQNEQGENFAYKRIKADPFHAEEAEQQIDIMRKFTHPHLVKIYEHHFEEDKQELHIIMEYCSGGDLAHFLKNNKQLSSTHILSILNQIVSAFIALSAQGVMHRDLKPENILIDSNNKIKIADFGCAKCVGVNNISLIDSRSMEKGTYLYASPEELKIQKYSFKCDIWAAGCIAYLLSYGRHPFIEANPHNVLSEIIKKTSQHPIELPKGPDQSISTFINLALLYSDVERPSWRQLQLCRIFAPKITNIEHYIDYLRSLSPIANHIVKQFWKIHKNFAFPQSLNEILVYYLIRFQMNNLKMCLKILKKSQSYNYLFDPKAFCCYQPKQQTFNEIKKVYLEYEKYFSSIKKTLQGKQCYTTYIQPYESKRHSSFIDLDKSIRSAYKILSWIKQVLPSHPSKDNKVWILLSRWTNFEQWFSFEKQPHFENMLSEPIGDSIGQITKGLFEYGKGSAE